LLYKKSKQDEPSPRPQQQQQQQQNPYVSSSNTFENSAKSLMNLNSSYTNNNQLKNQSFQPAQTAYQERTPRNDFVFPNIATNIERTAQIRSERKANSLNSDRFIETTNIFQQNKPIQIIEHGKNVFVI
jgi:hypothetical protein